MHKSPHKVHTLHTQTHRHTHTYRQTDSRAVVRLSWFASLCLPSDLRLYFRCMVTVFRRDWRQVKMTAVISWAVDRLISSMHRVDLIDWQIVYTDYAVRLCLLSYQVIAQWMSRCLLLWWQRMTTSVLYSLCLEWNKWNCCWCVNC